MSDPNKKKEIEAFQAHIQSQIEWLRALEHRAENLRNSQLYGTLEEPISAAALFDLGLKAETVRLDAERLQNSLEQLRKAQVAYVRNL